MARSTTLHDVAAALGVSARTVSRAVNGEPGLSAATRERVLAAVQEMDYRTNLLARGLRANRSNTIALVLTDLTDPFFPSLAHSVQRAAALEGNILVVAAHEDTPGAEGALLASLNARGVDGTIIFPSSDSNAHDGAVAWPTVVIDDQGTPTETLAFVRNDLEGGARAAVDHLLGQGHRDIAMISNANAPARRRDRDNGYREAMCLAGLSEVARLVYEQPTIEGGRRATEQLLALETTPTAVFAYNDVMAIGVLQAIRSAGKSVPKDLAIVGFDDIRTAQLMTPPLSSVHIDPKGLGEAAVARLLELIAPSNDSTNAPNHETPLLPCELVVRESSLSQPTLGGNQ